MIRMPEFGGDEGNVGGTYGDSGGGVPYNVPSAPVPPSGGPLSAPGQLEDTQPRPLTRWESGGTSDGGGTCWIYLGDDGQTHETCGPMPTNDPNRLGPGNTVADLFDRLFNSPTTRTVSAGDGAGTMTWVPGAATSNSTSGLMLLMVAGVVIVGYVLWKHAKGAQHE